MTRSQSQPGYDATAGASACVAPSAAFVACDLCQWPMAVPAHCLKTGRIEGLLVCTLCTEDTLTARLLENTL